MNRRTKIIVSVAGIFIVLLALLGLTYAYFLTRINGNTNDKSISVSTANLRLDYEDGNGTITGTNIMPGTELTEKTFTVTNSGNVSTDYIIVLEDIINTFTRKKDIKYTLTCTSSSGTCTAINDKSLVTSDDLYAMVVNTIPKNVTHTYTLTLTYENVDEDQSIDMGKELSARVNIRQMDMGRENTLQYAIINNAKNNTNGTQLMAQPLTIPAQEISEENEKVLSIAPDDYGLSYYYRGSVENNFLELNNMCFRIVRIEGDGSIKVTLANNGLCSAISTDSGVLKESNGIIPKKVAYGYTTTTVNGNTNYNFDYEGYAGGLYTTLNDWYNTNLKSVEGKLKSETWCLGGKTSRYNYETGVLLDTIDETAPGRYWYETGTRLFGTFIDDKHFDRTAVSATYRCSSEADKVTNYVGSLLADEAAYSGGVTAHNTALIANTTYYLYDNAQTSYWLLSRLYYYYPQDAAFIVHSGSCLGVYIIQMPYNAVRPTVTIAAGAELLSGDGTQVNPYKIVEN